MADTTERALFARAAALVAGYEAHGWRIVTAESCTGGLVAALLTEVPGSSAVLEAGFVTYSNGAKAAMLDVPADLLNRHGAVSEAVARAMAVGALTRSGADVAVSITGIAGPGGATPAKPVGLVHFALALRSGDTHHLERRYGDLGRSQVRGRSVEDAVGLLEGALEPSGVDQSPAGSRP